MDSLVQACGVLVGGLLLVLFAAMIWSSASLLWAAWRKDPDGRA